MIIADFLLSIYICFSGFYKKNMNILDLITKGYFPKELPPSFFTELFGANFNAIATDINNNQTTAQTQYENQVNTLPNLTSQQINEEKVRFRQIFKNRLAYSECAQYSIPKPGLARNNIKIPNPLHQGKICEVISANYTDIENIFKKSKYSTTKPILEQETGQGKRAVKHQDYGFFKESCILNSFKFSIHLKSDISKFYPSIYTHSVPWVTFGSKERYKRNRALHPSDTQKITVIYGDDIDNRLMWCQNQQTIGIPIGPDTSFIAAEVIACNIDELLEKYLKKKKIEHLILRYYDDYAMYFHTELDAQIALTGLKSILNDFELKVNDEKTHIKKSQNLNLLSFNQITDRQKVQEKLTNSENQIKELLDRVSAIQKDLKKFEKRKPFFVIERRLEELEVLTSKEIEIETKQNKELLYDPKYAE